MKKELEAHEARVSDVLDSAYSFQIPDYQRPYSWGKDNASQLVEDLIDSMERNSEEPYFLGSVVLVKENSASAHSEVIDGQQRLTTLTLLIALLRDLLDDKDYATNLQTRLAESGDVMKGTQPSPRLTLRRRDADFFESWVQTVGRTEEMTALPGSSCANDAQIALRDNAKAMREILTQLDQKKLQALAKHVGQRTYFVVVSTPDIESAHRIFTVMNSRGLDLSAADLIKSKVIGALADEDSAKYSDRWEETEERLGRDAFMELFQHLRTVLLRERAKVALLREYEASVLPQHTPQHFIDGLVLPYAAAYERIEQPAEADWEDRPQITRWYQRLAELDHDDWKAPALWLTKHLRHEPARLEKMLKALERLAASIHIRRVYATPRAQRYIAVLDDLAKGHIEDSPGLALTTQECTNTRASLDGDVYLGTRSRRYILARLDESLETEDTAAYRHSLLTVEHVLPQNPAEDSEWIRDFDEDAREVWTHRLANLVLLNRRKNSEANNYDFEKKKQRYFAGRSGTTTFALTTQVLASPAWTPGVLRERQNALMDRCIRMWDLT